MIYVQLMCVGMQLGHGKDRGTDTAAVYFVFGNLDEILRGLATSG